MDAVGTADTTANMGLVLKRHRETRKALKIARLLAALDLAAADSRPESRRTSRVSFSRA
jgi:hypothetical protein